MAPIHPNFSSTVKSLHLLHGEHFQDSVDLISSELDAFYKHHPDNRKKLEIVYRNVTFNRSSDWEYKNFKLSVYFYAGRISIVNGKVQKTIKMLEDPDGYEAAAGIFYLILAANNLVESILNYKLKDILGKNTNDPTKPPPEDFGFLNLVEI